MIEIAQALLFDRDGKLLIYLRDDKPTILFPNHWDLIGGHVEAGETPAEGLCREVRKEIALTLDRWRLTAIAAAERCHCRLPIYSTVTPSTAC